MCLFVQQQHPSSPISFLFFFFNDTATTEIYTLSLHDALPISVSSWAASRIFMRRSRRRAPPRLDRDRKSTRLNSSHLVISYAVFCLKKKKLIRIAADCTCRPCVPSLRQYLHMALHCGTISRIV